MASRRTRVWGEDSPFTAWVRSKIDSEIPSEAIAMTDVDVICHRYRSEVDAIGTREVQFMMQIEVKTRNGGIHPSQRDTLRKQDAFLRRKTIEVDGQTIKHFGVSVLFLSGESPLDSDVIRWGRFKDGMTRRISDSTLVDLLNFDIDPDSFDRRPWRRHHRTRELIVTETTPLGFAIDKPVVHRS